MSKESGDEMKKKNLKRLIIVTIFLVIILFICQGYVQAAGKDFDPDLWEPDTKMTVTNATKIQELANRLIGGIQIVGSIISVIAIIIIGIKYMLGSVEEKAGYKKSMLPYFIGAILVFSASTIASIIYNLAK